MKNCRLAFFLLLLLFMSVVSMHDAVAETVDVTFINATGHGTASIPGYTCNIYSVIRYLDGSMKTAPLNVPVNQQRVRTIKADEQFYYQVHYGDCIDLRDGTHNGFQICPDGTNAADKEGTGCPKYQSSATFVIKTTGDLGTTLVVEKR
jgi:hypothetical protein